MNWIDIAIIVVVAWFTFSAFQAGFIRETVTIVAAVAGVALAGIFYGDLAENVFVFVNNDTLSRIVAFGVVFGAVVLAGQMFALVLKPTVHMFQLGVFDQLLGAAFGFVKAFVFVEIFLIVFIAYPKWGLAKDIDHSLFGSLIVEKAPVLVKILPSEFKGALDNFPGKG